MADVDHAGGQMTATTSSPRGVRPVHDAVARWRSVPRERFRDGGEYVHAAGGVIFNRKSARDLGFHVRQINDHAFSVNGARPERSAAETFS